MDLRLSTRGRAQRSSDVIQPAVGDAQTPMGACPAGHQDEWCRLPATIRQAVGSKGGALFVSPHLDDVVLSCGGLVHSLASCTSVTVITAFSEAGPPPHTLAARSFLDQSGGLDAAELYARRRAEDVTALSRLGAKHVHLGLSDALFRRRGTRLGRATGRVVPELGHLYPTYWLDISRGRVARGDELSSRLLAAGLLAEAHLNSYAVVFSPLGVGNHVDHVIARDVAARVFPDTVYYAEYPYLVGNQADQDFIDRHHLVEWRSDCECPVKRDALAAYRSQMPHVMRGRPSTKVAETYYLAHPRASR